MTVLQSLHVKRDAKVSWVRETRFGRWFLTTQIWFRYVLAEATLNLKKLLQQRDCRFPRILDAGCGGGISFSLLEQYFQPKTIIALDIDEKQIRIAFEQAKQCRCEVIFEQGSAHRLDLADSSIDMVFCHQLLHHVSDQEQVLREFYRVLAPNGVVLISESCRPFIETLLIRLLFRHPMHVQKSAQEYVALIRSIGFCVEDHQVKTDVPWWSRGDLGILERLGLQAKQKEPTELLAIARKVS